MKKEHYVSFKVDKLLAEKGFDRCLCEHKFIERKSFKYVVLHSVPPLHMAQRWLREEKGIHIMIDVCASGYYAVIWKTNGTFIKTLADQGPNDGGVWNTYEEALDAGFMEALKFI